MENICYIYDIFVVLTFFIGIYLGQKRGFIRTVMGLAVYIIALVGASVLSDRLAEPVYEQYIREPVETIIAEKMQSSADVLEDRIKEIFGEKSISEENFEGNFSEYLTNSENSDKINEVLTAFFRAVADSLKGKLPGSVCVRLIEADRTGGVAQALAERDFHLAAEIVTDNAVRPVVLRMLGYVIWSVCFMTLSAAGRIIVSVIAKVRKIGAVRKADGLLGGIIGGVKSGIIIAAAVVVIKVISGAVHSDSGFFSENAINGTLIFKYIYNLIN